MIRTVADESCTERTGAKPPPTTTVAPALRAAMIAGLLLAAWTPAALAHGGADEAVHITIEGREGDGCPSGKTYCFVVTEGHLDDLEADTTVRLTFVNSGQIVHNLAVTRLADADPEHVETPMAGLFAGTAEEIEPGETQTFFFHIPADATGIYLWCHVPGHEVGGMWIETAVASADGTSGGDDTDAPAPAAVGIMAALLVALALVRRTRPRV